jgi:ubiquitin-like 1-activating enzyme E1 A
MSVTEPISIVALWEFQARQGILPNDGGHAIEIQEIADAMLAAANVNPAGLASIPPEMTMYGRILTSLPGLTRYRAMATTSAHEFSPVCAVLGGMLGQDILKALAAREAPIANFFTFDGITGAGATVRMGLA